METTEENLAAIKSCKGKYVRAIDDTLNALNGKWKLPIIAAMVQGNKRFSDIMRAIPKLTPRMLSKELRDLEGNGLVERHVYDRLPVLVEYELTPSALLLEGVLDKMIEWGLQHRETVMGTTRE